MKKSLKTILIGVALTTALTPQVAQSSQHNVTVERQVYNNKPITVKKSTIKQIGGLDLVTEFTGKPFGLTPKEYGIRFGNGRSKKSKINKIQRSHLYKVGKR